MDKTPGSDVFPSHDSRKLHDAEAGQRRLAQHRDVVGDEAGAVRDQRRLAVSMIELPLMTTVRRAGPEAGKPAQIARRREGRSDQRRTCDEALDALVEPPHYEVGRFERWSAHADRHIEAFGDHIDPAIGAFQMHLHCRVHDHEPGNQ